MMAGTMQYLDFGTVFFLITAVVIIYQLRSVLGRRTGNERPPFDPYTEGRLENQPPADDNVVALPRRKKKGDGEGNDEFYAPVDVIAEKGTPLNKGLRQIRDADPGFDPKGFVDGAKMAYEMIVTAYAEGDRKTLRNLLSRDVFEGFDLAITAREKAGESMRSSFVGISRAEIVNAEVRGNDAMVTLRIVSEMISATMDASGEVIDGDPESVTEGTDIWTFARDLRSRDPNWKLVATEEE